MSDYICKNKVVLSGYLESDFQLDYQSHGKEYYKNVLRVRRLSGNADRIPVLIEKVVLKEVTGDVLKGKVRICGYIFTYNRGKTLKMGVRVSFLCSEEETMEDKNEVFLEGVICCPSTYRTTPLGSRITDIKLACNGLNNRTAYIPSIAWNRNAELIKELEVGTMIVVKGRFQSRVYQKVLAEDICEERETYELSIVNYWVLENEENLVKV